ncbi:hypothetical protein M0R45_006857 [Rubus argutus]|uniref:Uncharacterized protein n=1 Tax=Rubus argutus TaxID=59490 RepID=A0AAW1YSG6_RUBAR
MLKAFARMVEDEDSGYLGYFKETEEEYDEDGILVPNKGNRSRVGPPTDEEWEKAEVFVQFLRVFYEITLRPSSRPSRASSSHRRQSQLVDAQSGATSARNQQDPVSLAAGSSSPRRRDLSPCSSHDHSSLAPFCHHPFAVKPSHADPMLSASS